MSLPDGAEYWNDVRAHFGQRRGREPKVHLLAEGASTFWSDWATRCGLEMPKERVRSKRKHVTCLACLAAVCRFVVTCEADGVTKVLAATDDVNDAQETYFWATDKKLAKVVLTDRNAKPASPQAG